MIDMVKFAGEACGMKTEPKRIDVNSLSVLQAMKFWLRRERHRHEQDIRKIDEDLYTLRYINIPEGLDLDAWYEVVWRGDTIDWSNHTY